MSLELKGVTKKFGGHTAVNNLHLEIPSGEMFGMLGSNGAGKTTTFRMIIGLLDPTKGNILWNGKPLGYKESHRIGYLPEERGLYPKVKVVDQLVYLGRLRGMKKADIIPEMRKWLKRFEVAHYEKKKVEELSKGNQQKIQFIASILHRPEVLILDEPFSGLDPVNVEMLKEAVLDIKRTGTTIVFSSHRMEHVEELCQHLCILQQGSPVVYGKLTEIKRSFGKMNLLIHADFDTRYLENVEGVVKYQPKAEGVLLQISSEETAHHIFSSLQGRGFVRRFSLEDPSLNDIFIEQAGKSYE
ncbi:ABC transporter ATP-binding protein [Thalassorhabdus alkalitolerans]|uniref:ABC transporter ATP-binding protein n=1 Tax=Thalassorhabdus alkalitolerans TaxID=2282697 RepID=A0ABW0YM87_9BACI